MKLTFVSEIKLSEKHFLENMTNFSASDASVLNPY